MLANTSVSRSRSTRTCPIFVCSLPVVFPLLYHRSSVFCANYSQEFMGTAGRAEIEGDFHHCMSPVRCGVRKQLIKRVQLDESEAPQDYHFTGLSTLACYRISEEHSARPASLLEWYSRNPFRPLAITEAKRRPDLP